MKMEFKKSVFECPFCKKIIRMGDTVYSVDTDDGGYIVHYYCVINALRMDYEREHNAMPFRLVECSNHDELCWPEDNKPVKQEHRKVSDEDLMRLLRGEISAINLTDG